MQIIINAMAFSNFFSATNNILLYKMIRAQTFEDFCSWWYILKAEILFSTNVRQLKLLQKSQSFSDLPWPKHFESIFFLYH